MHQARSLGRYAILLSALLTVSVAEADELVGNATVSTPAVVEASYTAGSATAASTVYAPPPGGIVVEELELFGPQLRYRSDVGSGLYDDGFHTLGVMVPFHIDPLETLWFVEARGYITNHNQYGGNVGVGYRWYDAENDQVNGASVWYDDDNTNVHQYQQLGVSLESLSYDRDLRFNLYYPTNSDANMLWQTPAMDPFYKNANIFFQQNTRWEAPFKGGDFEVGVPVPFLDEDMNTKIFAGGYYLDGDQEGVAIGPRLRLQAELTPEAWTYVQYTHDRVWGSRVTFAIALDLPGGPSDEFRYQQPMQHKLAAQVQRDYRVHAHRHTDRAGLIAINPDDLEPFEVAHVDNTAGAGGDGTYESPFSVLPATVDPGTDIIFVRRGDETYTGLDGGITLSANQRLLGESVAHAFEAVRGRYQLPGYNAGALPYLFSTGGPVVTLGDDSEVTGFRIQAPNGGGDGIVGTDINGFTIRANEITRTDGAVVLTDVTGRGSLIDNMFYDNAQHGVQVNNSVTGDFTLTASNNTITGNSGNAIEANVFGNGRVNIFALGGTYSSNRFNGIDVNASGNSSVTFSMMADGDNNNPTVSSNRYDGVEFTSQDTSIFSTVINNSTITNNGIYGIFSRESDTSTLTSTTNGNTVTGNGTQDILSQP